MVSYATAEFGPKAQLSYTNGFVFLDKMSFDAFSENKELANSIEKHEERFEKVPKTVLIDDGYSSRENRNILAEKSIEHSLKTVGRSDPKKKYRKTKLRKMRSEVEGIIGTLKEHWRMDKIRFLGEDGAEIQTYLTFGCHNLVKVVKMMA